MAGRRKQDGTGLRADDSGLSMVVTALALVATALLTLVAVDATLSSGGSSTSSGAGNPQVAMADHIQAQQALTTSLEAIASPAGSGTVDGVGGLGGTGAGGTTGGDGGSGSNTSDIAQLSAADPSVTYVDGSATDASTVSVATDPTATGAITLATRSADSVCWLVWHSPGTATWYGAQTHLVSCTAPVLGSPPSPGPVTSSAIGWQTGGFPSV